MVSKRTIDLAVSRPLIQKVLSDILARNNVYLYGGVYSKTYSARTISKSFRLEFN